MMFIPPLFKIEGVDNNDEDCVKQDSKRSKNANKSSPTKSVNKRMKKNESGEYEEWNRSTQRSSSLIVDKHSTIHLNLD